MKYFSRMLRSCASPLEATTTFSTGLAWEVCNRDQMWELKSKQDKPPTEFMVSASGRHTARWESEQNHYE